MNERDRCLLNWLATRVTADGKVRAGHSDEAKLINRMFREAMRRRLHVVPDRYLVRTLKDPPADDQSLTCDACGRRFNGEYSFDKHRTGPFETRAPASGSHGRAGPIIIQNARRCRSDDGLNTIGLFYNQATDRWSRPYEPRAGKHPI